MKESFPNASNASLSPPIFPPPPDDSYYGRSMPGVCSKSPDTAHYWYTKGHNQVTRVAQLVCRYCLEKSQD